MKKILTVVALAATLFTSQAQAGNDGALVGGLIGGLIIGGIIGQHNHEYVPRYRDPYYNDGGWEQRCYTQYRTEYNYAYGMYENVPRTVCRWVHRY